MNIKLLKYKENKDSKKTSLPLPQVSKEFIEENQITLDQFSPKQRRSGPYIASEKEARRNQVYKLNFDYGYSARKIARQLKVSRNTINLDIRYWYDQITKNFNIVDPSVAVAKQIERFEIQRTRLRTKLDKTRTTSEQISIERLILEIDNKITQIRIKIKESSTQVHKLATRWLNDKMKQMKNDDRYITFDDTIKVSDKSHDKINRILNQDHQVDRI